MQLSQELLLRVLLYRQLLADYDTTLYNHCQKVGLFSFYIAEKIGLSPEEKVLITCGAFLHDVGKVGLPSELAYRQVPMPGGILAEHPQRGVQLIQDNGDGEVLAPLLPLIYSHHECMDGSGYPRGIKGESIPLGARIIAVADAIDVMFTCAPTSGRLLSFEELLDELLRGAGSHFDENIVLELMRNMYEVRLLFMMGVMQSVSDEFSEEYRRHVLAESAMSVSVDKVSREMGVSTRTIYRYISKYLKDEMMVNRRGRPSKIDRELENYIDELKSRHPNYSASRIARLIEQEKGVTISRQTVWRYIKEKEGVARGAAEIAAQGQAD